MPTSSWCLPRCNMYQKRVAGFREGIHWRMICMESPQVHEGVASDPDPSCVSRRFATPPSIMCFGLSHGELCKSTTDRLTRLSPFVAGLGADGPDPERNHPQCARFRVAKCPLWVLAYYISLGLQGPVKRRALFWFLLLLTTSAWPCP